MRYTWETGIILIQRLLNPFLLKDGSEVILYLA